MEQDTQFQTVHVLDLFHSAGRLEQNQYDIVYRILLDDDYRALLSKAGFNNIQIYGDYQLSEYNKNSKRLIVVAEKEELGLPTAVKSTYFKSSAYLENSMLEIDTLHLSKKSRAV